MAPIVSQFARRYFFTSSLLRCTKSHAMFNAHVEEGSFKLWRRLLFFAAIPAIMLCGLNCVMKHNEHPNHRPKFIKYDYLCVRTKRFPWGDGSKSLFHNPKINALPNGYEDEVAVNESVLNN